MSPRNADCESGSARAADFASTRWSVVLAAGRDSSPGSREALETLCRSYWRPLYGYVRRRVADAHEAQDLIQEFFARLLDKNVIAVADPERGRFRAFLLTSLRNFLANQWEKSRAEKRGGGRTVLSLDLQYDESQSVCSPTDDLTPERLFDRQWAETLIDHVMTTLREEFAKAGKIEHFERLKVFLTGRSATLSYADAARGLGVSEGAAMVAAHRLRRRFRDLLRAEIAQTLADPKDVDDEIRFLFAALGP
jgi:RNA polymerase sigma-70 factor (ECF subfamily)